MRQFLSSLIILSIISVSTSQAQSPGNIGDADLFMWLKADAGISSNNNGDPVALWQDQSPNGNDAVQTDPAAQPVFNTKRINGYPALRFNQSSRFLNIPFDAMSDGDYTIFIVAQRSNANVNSYLMASTGSTSVGFELGLPTQNEVSFQQFGSSSLQNIPDFSSDEVPMIFQVSNSPIDGLNNMISRSGNNYNGSDLPSGGTDALTGFLGKNDDNKGFRGHIAEVIVFDRQLIFSEINSVRTYLASKYGLTISSTENTHLTDAAFNHATFVLEKDADQGLDITRSESEEPLSIAQAKSIATMNEDEYLLIGHNNQPINFTTSGIRCGLDQICDREWKIASNFIPNNLKIEFDFTDYPSVDLNTIYLLIDFNNNGYSDDQITYGIVNGSKITFTLKGIDNGHTFTLADGKTRWTAMTSGLSSDPIWSPTGTTADLQIAPSCEHAEYTISAGTTVNVQNDLEAFKIENQGTLIMNDHKMTVYSDFTNDGTVDCGTSSLAFEGDLRTRLRGSSVTTLYNLTFDGSLDFRIQVPELRLENVLSVENGTFKTGNKLVLLSTADQTAMIGPINGSGVLSGRITAQRFHNAQSNGYVMMGTPVKSQEITDLNDHLITTGFVGSDWPDYPFNNIKAYDESTPGLRSEGFIGTTGLNQNLVKGKGWMIYMAEGSQFVDLNGAVWQGDQNLPVSYTDTSMPLEDGWNLVANPYACTINWDAGDPAWIKENMEDAIYVFDAEQQTYSSYVNGIGNNGGSGNIAPFQAFWTKANAADPVLMITEQAKNPIQADFKNEPATPLRLTIGSGTFEDETTFYWSDSGTSGFDSELEAEKLYLGEVTSIASTTENGMALSIQALANSAEEINIPLEVIIYTSRPWRFNAEGWDQIQNGRCVYLHDSETNMSYPLYNGEVAEIEIEEGNYTERFSLRSSASALEEVTQPSCFGSVNGSISVASSNISQMEWFNSNNEMLLSTDMNESTLNNLGSGVYQVEMASDGICDALSLSIVLVEPSELSSSNEVIQPNCPGTEDGSIMTSSMGGTAPYTYQWNDNNEDDSLFNLPEGNYNFTVTDANGCELSESFELTAQHNPQVQFEVESEVIMEGGIAVVPFSNNSTGVENYVWSLGDGNLSTEEQPTHVYNEAGIYTVSLTGTAGECSQTWEQNISVQSPVGIFNTDLEEQTTVTWTDQGLRVLQNTENQSLIVNVYNVLGQQLAKTESTDQEILLKVPGYIQHVLVEVQNVNGTGRMTLNLAR